MKRGTGFGFGEPGDARGSEAMGKTYDMGKAIW